jgi:hypothetical protein
MRALAGLGKTTADTALAIGKPIAAREGAKKGAIAAEEAITIDPATGETVFGEMQEKKFGYGAQAFTTTFDNAYQSAYSTDVRTNAARIAAESDGSVATFDAKIKGYFEGMKGGSNIPPELRVGADVIAGSYRTQIAAKEAQTVLDNAETDRVIGIKTASDDAFKFIQDGSKEAADLSIAQVRISYQAGIDNEDYTSEEGRVLLEEFDNQVLMAQGRRTLDTTVESQGYIAGLDYISNIETNLPESMSVKEREAYINVLTTDLSRTQSLADARQAEMAANLKIRQAGNATSIFVNILEGTGTLNDITQAARDNKITFSQLQSLETQFNTTGGGFDDAEAITEINSLMRTDPKGALEAIRSATGSKSLSRSTALLLTKTIQQDQDSGGLLKTSAATRFSKHLYESIIVRGAMGAIDQDAQVNASQMQTVYNERVSAGEIPAIVAKELIAANRERVDPSEYAKGFKTLDGALANLYTLRATSSHPLNDAAIFDNEYYKLKSYFDNIGAYENFKSDYDEIMKGL